MRFKVRLASDTSEEQTKQRTVTVSKASVYKDIDLYTHKAVDGSGEQDNRVRNAKSSDSAEGVDMAVLARNVEFRDAKLRRRVRHVLADITREDANDNLTLDEENYIYLFDMPMEFDDNLLRPLAEYIHRFLVFGALYDWYAQFDMRQAAYYGGQLEEIEDEIDSMLRSTHIVKRPLQPFGPAKFN